MDIFLSQPKNRTRLVINKHQEKKKKFEWNGFVFGDAAREQRVKSVK